jgi:hypothetical protein
MRKNLLEKLRSAQLTKKGIVFYPTNTKHWEMITISFPSCVQTLVSSSHSHLKFCKTFLKVLKNTTRFGQYGHPQVLTFLVGETAAIVCVPLMRTYVVLGVLLPVDCY